MEGITFRDMSLQCDVQQKRAPCGAFVVTGNVDQVLLHRLDFSNVTLAVQVRALQPTFASPLVVIASSASKATNNNTMASFRMTESSFQNNVMLIDLWLAETGDQTAFVAAGGGAAQMQVSSAYIERCLFVNNRVERISVVRKELSMPFVAGAVLFRLVDVAVMIDLPSLIISNCTFHGNSLVNVTSATGAALSLTIDRAIDDVLQFRSARIDSCLFSENRADLVSAGSHQLFRTATTIGGIVSCGLSASQCLAICCSLAHCISHSSIES